MSRMSPHEMGERVDRLIAEVHSPACHAPTTPIMSDLDMALLYLRHASAQIHTERSSR